MELAWRLVQLPKITDTRGNLTVVEGATHIDFEIARVYYLYDVPGGSERAGHAHKALKQLIIPVAGSFDVNLEDGFNKQTIAMNRADVGLLISSMVWRTITNFSSGAVCLSLASMRYDEADYYRSYDEFLANVKPR
jgi:hypothetical protein